MSPCFKKIKSKHIFIFLFACFIPCLVLFLFFFFYDQYTCIFTVKKEEEEEEDEPLF